MTENNIIIHCDKIIKLHNNYHLGDNIFNICYFNKISSYLKENNIIICYYLKEEYINQVLEFLTTNCVILIPIENENEYNVGFQLWIGNQELLFNINSEHNTYSLNDFYVKFFNIFSGIIGVPIHINELEYTDTDLLRRYDLLDEKYKNIDILLVNSIPLSGQLDYDESKWNFLANILNKRYDVVTTKKVHGIKCTLDDGLSVKNIGALSSHVKVIITVNTGVITGILNTYTINNARGIFVFDHGLYYSYKNFYNYSMIDDIDIEKIFQLLNSHSDN